MLLINVSRCPASPGFTKSSFTLVKPHEQCSQFCTYQSHGAHLFWQSWYKMVYPGKRWSSTSAKYTLVPPFSVAISSWNCSFSHPLFLTVFFNRMQNCPTQENGLCWVVRTFKMHRIFFPNLMLFRMKQSQETKRSGPHHARKHADFLDLNYVLIAPTFY